VHLVGFIIRTYHDARSPERHIHLYTFKFADYVIICNTYSFHIRTVHLDIVIVLFIHQLMH